MNHSQNMIRAIQKVAVSVFGSLALGVACASGGDFPLDNAPNRLNSNASLQNGAKIFVNYCLGCHSAVSLRYNRLRDIGLSDQQIKDNLLLGDQKVGDLMTIAMNPKDAKAWFGKVPPDLSVEARARGTDWLYTYFRTYYKDPERPTGWNNLAYPNVGMPHVLWELQGVRRPIFEERDEHGHKVQVFKGWEQVTPGTLTPQQYDQAMADLVGYLQWMGEPAQLERKRIGVWVLMFLAIFTVLAWGLNKAYWKDIH